MEHNNSNLARKQAQTEISVVEEQQADVKAVRKDKPAKPVSGEKKVKPASGEKRKAKPAAGEKIAEGKEKKAKTVSEEKKIKQISGEKEKTSGDKKGRAESQEEFENRMRRRDEARALRREERRRRVRRQKIAMAAGAGVIVVAAAALCVFCMPSMKLSRSLAKGGRYTEQSDYANAQSAYEKALTIDTGSVEAYRGMADNYVAQGNIQEAKQILYTGWEKTQDEGLLHYYCVELYNEAVHEINAGECTLATVDKCLQVLEQEPDNPDAPGLLGTCYERLFGASEEEAVCSLFFDADTAQDTCSYAEYESLVRRLFALYQAKPSEMLGTLVKQYAVIDMPYVQISLPHLEAYRILLTEVNSAVNDAGITDTMACLARAKEVSDYFDTAFQEFGAENYAYARDLVAQESYQQIRDSFIEENSGYWEGSIYIPVSREQLVLHRVDGQVRFSFLDGEQYDNHEGIIKVWGTQQEDDGVQRSVISYEPPAGDTAGSHTEYTVQYLYSNVKIDGQYVPQMNYRFDTKVTTEEGITTNAIGDWGGEHEWEIDY